MANHKSAEKRARQTKRREVRNTRITSSLKTFEKNLVKSISQKSKDVETQLRTYMSAMMSAVSKGIVKKETASRKIGRLSARAHAK